MPINTNVQNNYDQLMKNTQDARLQAISKEIDELVKDENTSNDKIDFNQIMDESLNIGKKDATKIINYINELLTNGFDENQDLINLKTYLTPLATPANNTIHESFAQDRTGVQEINLKDRTLSDWLNNRDYGLNRRMNSIISRIGNNENLQNLKTNIMFIKDICDGKQASRSDFDRIKKYLISNIDQRTTVTEIAGEAQSLDREFSVNNNEDVRKVFLLLNQFLIETNNHLDDISNANNVREQINQERRSANAAINKFITRDFLNNSSNTGDYQVWNYFPELDDNETDKIKDYIKESASDNVDNSTKKDILSTYRKYLTYTSEVPPYGNNLNQIKETVEAEYKEVGIINNFIKNFINRGIDFNDANLTEYATNPQINKNNLANLITLYIENDGSQNPDIVSYYRNNLAGEQANNIEEHYPEIQETIQSIDKLVQINKLRKFSKLSDKDISNITKYIEATSTLRILNDTPKEKILNYYNANIKGKEGEGSDEDKKNFKAIKDAIEGETGYRTEIVNEELGNLKNYLESTGGDITQCEFNSNFIKDYINNNNHICIFNEDEFNKYKEIIRRGNENRERENNLDSINNLINNSDLIEKYASSLCGGNEKNMPLSIIYDNNFTAYLGNNKGVFDTLESQQKENLKNTWILNLNKKMFSISKDAISSFNCDIDSGKNPSEKVLYNLGETDIEGIKNIKVSDINDTNINVQKTKLSKIQKIHYVLNTLKNPGSGNHNDGWEEIGRLQNKIGMNAADCDKKFGEYTLLKAKNRINQ